MELKGGADQRTSGCQEARARAHHVRSCLKDVKQLRLLEEAQQQILELTSDEADEILADLVDLDEEGGVSWFFHTHTFHNSHSYHVIPLTVYVHTIHTHIV